VIKLLEKIVNAILNHLGSQAVNWNDGLWQRVLMYPPTLEQQMDSWSCGLFTMMAMQAYTQGILLELVEDSQKESGQYAPKSTFPPHSVAVSDKT
jgi:hypothetical protein